MQLLKKKVGHSSHAAPAAAAAASGSTDDIDEVDDGAQNILMGIIAQLRPGCDLTRITLPTFILERKSMLERITNQLQQPDILIEAAKTSDKQQRFLLVVKWYMSCWHICPKAVKKPLNPILGEYFTCYWDLPDGHKAYYVAEQTSHHPPKSSYFYIIPHLGIRVDGIVVPQSKFLGNSTAAIMAGVTKLTIGDDIYTLTQPNMYARGILFGTLKFELGDHLIIQSKSGFKADIDFKTKGFIGGTYNAIEGKLFDEEGKQFGELTGKWNEVIYIKLDSSKKETFFDTFKAEPVKPIVRPLEQQGDFESRKLWLKVTDALAIRNHEIATNEKFKIEETQREDAKKRVEDGVDFHPKLFKPLTLEQQSEFGNEHLEFIIYKDIHLQHHIGDEKGTLNNLYEMAPFLPDQKFNDQFEIPAFKKN